MSDSIAAMSAAIGYDRVLTAGEVMEAYNLTISHGFIDTAIKTGAVYAYDNIDDLHIEYRKGDGVRYLFSSQAHPNFDDIVNGAE